MEIIRVDEVARFYKPVEKIETWTPVLFWINSFLSYAILFPNSFTYQMQNILPVFFILSVSVQFVLTQIVRMILLPKAELIRRRQMISDSLGTKLTHERTSLYYNNEYPPSFIRLCSNTLENSFFSKEISEKMLFSKRIITGVYILLWLLLFTLRNSNLEVLIWITQIVFSGGLLAKWLNLEILHSRYEKVYEDLHLHFLNKIGEKSQCAVATILDSFVAYEAAKSTAGYLLSTKIFNKLNSQLSDEWEKIRKDLEMKLPNNKSHDGTID